MIANNHFENEARFGYLGRTVTNENFVHEEVKITLISGNPCHRSIQNILSSRLLSKTLRIN
jgi:hypothetical protein